MTSPFTPFDTQYSAHTDVTIHPVTGVLSITVAFHPNNKGGYNCKLWELDPPYTNPPRFVREYVQGVASVGPFGHGASIALPTGGVLTCVPVAGESSEVKPSITIDPTLGQPYALQTGGGMTMLIPQHTARVPPNKTYIELIEVLGTAPTAAGALAATGLSATATIRVSGSYMI